MRGAWLNLNLNLTSKTMKTPKLNTITTYDNVDDLLETAQANDGYWWDGERRGSHKTGDHALDFRGTRTFDDAVKIATKGWAHRPSTKLANTVINRLSEAQAPTYELQYDVAGGAVDMGAFLSGEPECMLSFAPVEAPKSVSIAINVTAAAMVSKARLQARGEATYAAVMALRNSGYIVNLDWIWPTLEDEETSENRWSCHHLTLSSSDRPMDEDKLAFWVQHPSALRRFGFALTTAGDREFQEAIGHYQGRPCEFLSKESFNRAPETLREQIRERFDIVVETLPEYHDEEDISKLAERIMEEVKEEKDGSWVV